MKMVRSLVLGFVAGLVAMGGAQAADLPTKAKAIEYVRVCSPYGPGFYYIPGTDTCIRLSGYLRVETALGTNAVYDTANGLAGARNRLINYYTARSREELSIDTRTATEYGVVRTFLASEFTWTTGGYTGAGSGATGGATAYYATILGGSGSGQIAGGALGVYWAFIQFAGFTMGKAISQFSAPWTNYPANNFDGLPGGGGWVAGVNQFSYTADFGQGITASISAQDQVASGTSNIANLSVGLGAGSLASASYGGNDIGGSRAPDLVGMVRVNQAWGLFQASVAAHDNHAGYYGAVETSGYPPDKWGWAGQLALSIKNIPTGPGDTINIQGVYTNGASRYNFHDLMATGYLMYGGTGISGAYQSVGVGVLTDSVFVTGSSQELTTTYGFRGGYTHNWNPQWNTGIYGAWAAVRYGNQAKIWICTGAVPGVVGGLGAAISTGVAGCSPDFNYSVVGLITRWIPVKNLTFSADAAYTMLNQKFASGTTFVSPAAVLIGKPAATYELKNQRAATLLLRAHRNW